MIKLLCISYNPTILKRLRKYEFTYLKLMQEEFKTKENMLHNKLLTDPVDHSDIQHV